MPPFTGPTPQAVMARHALDPVPDLGTVRSTVPEGVIAAVERAMSKVPADRYPSAGAFAAALARGDEKRRGAAGRRRRGALAVGAALGLIAVVVRQEIVFIVMAGVFVMETVSVILQVASFKLTGKRIFRMAPVHHHFELKGWPEPRVIVRFWIISVILVLIGLATLNIR